VKSLIVAEFAIKNDRELCGLGFSTASLGAMNIIIAIILILIWLAVAAKSCPTRIESSLHRVVGVTVFVICATVLAILQSYILEVEACVDSGGVLTDNGYCQFEQAPQSYVAQLARPNLYILWTAFVVNILVPAWFVRQTLNYFWQKCVA
jgi:hypothetical protein